MQALSFDIAARDQTASVFAKLKRNADQTFGAINKGLAAFGFSAGIAGVVASTVQMIDRSTDLAKSLAATAEQTGLTVSQLQKLRYAGVEAGRSVQSIDYGLSTFSANLGRAANGQGKLAQLTKQYGIETKTTEGQVRSVDAVMRDLADAYQEQGSAAERARISEVAFGGAWREMQPLLKDGSEGLREAGERARESGAILEEHYVSKLKMAAAEHERLNKVMETGDARLAANLARWRRWGTEFQIWATDKVDAFTTKMLNALGVMDQFSDGGDFQQRIDLLNKKERYGFVLSRNEGIERASLQSRIGRGAKGDLGDDPTGRAMNASDLAGPGGSFGLRRGGNRGGTPPAWDPEGDRERDQVEKMIKALEHEQLQLGRTAREQAIYNQVQRAGEHATEAQIAVLKQKAGQLYDVELAQKALNERTEYFGSLATDAFTDIIVRGDEVEDVLKRISEALAEAVIQAALLGQGPFASMMGTAPATAGGTGGLFGALFGGFKAKGGPLDPGKWYIAGEKGPEPIWGGGPGAFAAPGLMGGGRSAAPVVNVQIINRVDAEVKTQVRQGDNGEIDIETVIDSVAAKKAGQPGSALNRQLSQGQPRIRR